MFGRASRGIGNHLGMRAWPLRPCADEPPRQRRAAAKQSGMTAAAPRTPAACFEAGLRLLKAGQMAEAEQCGRQALALDSGHADSLHLMGLLCAAAKQYDLAIEWFAQAIRQNPNVSDYFSNLAAALEHRGRLDEAIKSLDRALTLKPDRADIWYRMGLLLEAAEPQGGREPQLRRGAQGRSAPSPGRQRGGARAFQRPQIRARACRICGVACDRSRASRRVASVGHLPVAAQALRGGACELLEGARADARRSRSHRQSRAHPAQTRFVRGGDRPVRCRARAQSAPGAGALSARRHARRIAPLRRGPCGLRQGACDRSGIAGRALERRACCGFCSAISRGAGPGGNGAANAMVCASSTGSLRSRYGVARPTSRARPSCCTATRGSATASSSRAMQRWWRSSARASFSKCRTPCIRCCPIIEGVALCLPKTGVTLPDFDLQCPTSDLPLAFATRLDTIPSAASYLSPQPARLREWQARLGAHDRLRVGLVWSGNPAHDNDGNRSVPFAAMTALLDVDACFISLQKDPRPADRALLSGEARDRRSDRRISPISSRRRR